MKEYNISKQKFWDCLVEQLEMKICYITCEATSIAVFDNIASSIIDISRRTLEIKHLINKKVGVYEC
jgi:hypothetical protein